jgi:hypothetical protein
MWLKCFGVLAATILAAGPTPAASQATLGLVVRRGAPVPAAVRQYLELETARAIRESLKSESPILAWRDESSLPVSESFDRLIVVSFQGDCTMTMPDSQQASGPLGWTSTADGRVLPFIGIDCSRVKAALAASDSWRRDVIPARILARAMSRVAMHEIYHVLSDRKHHDEEGLFKAEYSAADLLAPAVLSRRAQHVSAGVSERR